MAATKAAPAARSAARTVPAPARAQRRRAGRGALEHVAAGVADVVVEALVRVASDHRGDLAHLARAGLDPQHVAHQAGELLARHELAHHVAGVGGDDHDLEAPRQAGEQCGHARKGVQVRRDGQSGGSVVNDGRDGLGCHTERRHALVDVAVEQGHDLGWGSDLGVAVGAAGRREGRGEHDERVDQHAVVVEHDDGSLHGSLTSLAGVVTIPSPPRSGVGEALRLGVRSERRAAACGQPILIP